MNLCNPQGFKNEIKGNVSKGKDIFFTWFDGGSSVADALKKAEMIFNRLMLPWARKFLNQPLNEKTSLDIGYGGGGQVLAASKYFKYALGVDVHEEIPFVERELKKRNTENNIALFTGNGKTLPIDDGKVDFVSSWVTFLHLGTIETVKIYLREIYRVLSDGGVAVIYYTRLIRSARVQSQEEYEADLLKERGHATGYREGGPLTLVNRPNLVLSNWIMYDLVMQAGFNHLDSTNSHDKDGIYGQHGIVIQKPKKKILKVRKPQSMKGKKND